MSLPDFTMRQLLEAGVHFGHQSHRWNPKMADYIFGARNNIHIIDLAQTVPDLIFVIDTNKEDIAIQEAQRLNIPVAAIVDTNCDPKGITYLVPGNDDAGRAISLYCDLIARAAIDGISRAQGDSGIDIGASAQPLREEIPEAAPTAGFQGLAGPRGTADDLKKLTGVSGEIEKKFNDLGIFHYWQLAELDRDTAHKIGEEVGLPNRADGWVAQAKAMTAEAE